MEHAASASFSLAHRAGAESIPSHLFGCGTGGHAARHDAHAWGEVAAQPKKPEAFRRFWAEGPHAPDETDWKELLGTEPTLIMFDELPAWFDYAVAQPVGGGTLANVARYALANLFGAARKTGNTCIVASNLSGGAYPDAVRRRSTAATVPKMRGSSGGRNPTSGISSRLASSSRPPKYCTKLP